MTRPQKIRMFVNGNPVYSQDFVCGLTPSNTSIFFPVEDSQVVSINLMNNGDILILYKNEIEQVFHGLSYIITGKMFSPGDLII
jgi:hypothetical protein